MINSRRLITLVGLVLITIFIVLALKYLSQSGR